MVVEDGKGVKQVTHLTEELRKILRLLGERLRKILCMTEDMRNVRYKKVYSNYRFLFFCFVR